MDKLNSILAVIDPTDERPALVLVKSEAFVTSGAKPVRSAVA